MYVGIENANEFYTHHYLAAIMAGDLNTAVFNKWKGDEETEAREPWTDLRKLNQDFFRLKELLEREPNVGTRIERHREFASKLLYALGYEPRESLLPVDGGLLPTLTVIDRPNGAPLLWCVPVVDAEAGEFADPLGLRLLEEQFDEDSRSATDDEFFTSNIEDLLTKKAFDADEAPRFVLVVGESQVLLLDRSKWAEKRLLRFDLVEILGRRDLDTLKATAALLHRESTCPSDGMTVLDTLDESSHKHAFGVSKDLKYALRESIELLGNEAIASLKAKHEGVFDRDIAEQLSLECLRFMYRLLFLFYIEARPELGYAPIQNETYLKGYSIDRLRDLEMMKLHTDDALNGHHIHDSLKLLFHLIWDGTDQERQQDLTGLAASYHGTFELFPLKSHLFDPERTPLLNRARLSNRVMQRIIKLMSLAEQGTGRYRRLARISYNQLGINQLGAVYEALLSYRGFFAEEDLYEVKRKGDSYDPLETAYFVNLYDLDRYDEDERVMIDGHFVKHEKGEFIYRLAGRDREKSASYYTPESLTQCLVKYALKELLEDEDGKVTKTADEILHLTVCEPAMGSAAFLNEAVNQLSEAYLQQRQKELGERIAHDDYALEKQKVKTYIADNNVFGVDLNPVAVELAEVSLWLNTIHEGGFVPWFGMQLCCGNSLIGARRQVFLPQHTKAKKKANMWLGKVPERIEPGTARPEGGIYHFLLGDDGMAKYTDAVIKGKGGKNPVKGLAEEEVAAINTWRKDFNSPLSAEDHEALVELSTVIDRLWDRHTLMLRDIRNRTTDHYSVWGDGADDREPHVSTTRQKDAIWHGELFSEGVRASSPYRRLKLVMDYWCALWFWPIEKAELLPTRDEFLFELGLLLDTDVFQHRSETQPGLFAPSVSIEAGEALLDEFGFVDVDALKARYRRLELVEDLTLRYRFLHWELEFTDLFAMRGGFDLVIGNPPWIKVVWNESGVLADSDPYLVIRNVDAAALAEGRQELLSIRTTRLAYLGEYEAAEGAKNFFSSTANAPLVDRSQANLYKCFLERSVGLARSAGVVGFLHEEGVYNDPKSGSLRRMMFRRLSYRFSFKNARLLFPIGDRRQFGVSILGPDNGEVDFVSISNLVSPRPIDDCFGHHGLGPVPGIKDANNDWDESPHFKRVVPVSAETLALFAAVFGDKEDPFGAPLPTVHSTPILAALSGLQRAPKLGGSGWPYHYSEGWDETNARKDGTMRRETAFASAPELWILSGPHIWVANAFQKTPRAICTEKSHYDVVDLTFADRAFLPRSNYQPDAEDYEDRIPRSRLTGGRLTDHFRLAARRRIDPAQERTLIAALIPPGVNHTNALVSAAFDDHTHLLSVAAAAFSVPADFMIKSTGKRDFYDELLRLVPVCDGERAAALHLRALLLSVVTEHYARLWQSAWLPIFREDEWTSSNETLIDSSASPEWHPTIPLRTDRSRRQALVELDVLVAQALALSLTELQSIYRTYFPTTQRYDADTYFDRNGRTVFTTNHLGLPGIGLARARSNAHPEGPFWEDVKDMARGSVDQVIVDDTMLGGPIQRTITYFAPFERCDRESDYARAWTEFERRYGTSGAVSQRL